MSRPDLRSVWAAVVVAAVLLLPLADFWISVLAGSRSLRHSLSGTGHTLPGQAVLVIVLPAVALSLLAWTFRHVQGRFRTPRRLARALALFAVLSLAVMFVYLLGENAGQVARTAGG
jgi:hypothetical protein